MKNILELLERAVLKYPEKTFVSDSRNSDTYDGIIGAAMAIGSSLFAKVRLNTPIAILIEKSVTCLEAMMGVLYSGCFYVVIDTEMPLDRIESIFNTLNPSAVIYDSSTKEKALMLDGNFQRLNIDKLLDCAIDDDALKKVRSSMIDTDIAYAIFTSGSTGVPKGVVVNHRNVLAYSEWTCNTFEFSSDTVFGNQTPFYFSMSVTDIFSALRVGGSIHIIPKSLFSFPIMLIEFLNEHKVNTIYWVPSALSIVANLKVLDYALPKYVDKIMFAGEVMPVKQLNYWRAHIPNAMYANLFGPTETTDICSYYVLDRELSLDESVPIGRHCDNCDTFILNDSGEKAKQGEQGELYARGSFLAMGYYNNPQKTAEAFVDNPLNTAYPEHVYKTGDIVKVNDKGEMIYICRCDYQIKHMGYRIELGEIEAASMADENVDTAVALYDSKKDEIILVFSGKKSDEDSVNQYLNAKLPRYMIPSRLIKISSMPYNRNGKLDRKALNEEYIKN